MEEEFEKTESIKNTLRLKGLLSADDNPEPMIVDQDSFEQGMRLVKTLGQRMAWLLRGLHG